MAVDVGEAARESLPFLDEEVTVPEALARVLEQAGVDMVFGMPGGLTLMLFDALHDHRETIRTVLVREESIATIMAEVYGRLTGRPGVAIGQGNFLFATGNLGTLEAYLSGSPMLLLSDMTDGAPYAHHGPYQSGSGEFGAWDARLGFSAITKLVMAPAEGGQAVQCTQSAIRHATVGEPGPVALLYHSSALRSRVGPDTRPPLYATDNYLPRFKQPADAEAVEKAAKLLADAERPVIIAGGGVCVGAAFSELRALAEAAGIAIATTAKGKSAVEEIHPLALGVFGTFGTPVANEFIGQADVILAVGTKLGPHDTANENSNLLDPSRQMLIQVDIEPRHTGWTFPATHTLIGDAGLALTQLTMAVEGFGTMSPAVLDARRAAVREAKENLGYFNAESLTSDSSPIWPQRLVRELSEHSTAETIFTCDAGENRLFMTHFFQTRGPGTFVQPAGIGGMGYAIPAALAAKLVHPDRPVVAVCGDGGFGMSMNALLTAHEENIPIVVVVMNNNTLGWVKHEQGSRVIAADLGTFDNASIARAMNCDGTRVTDPSELPRVLRDALTSDRPTLIDVVTSPDQTYKAAMSPMARSPEAF